MVSHGSVQYGDQWDKLMNRITDAISSETQIDRVEYAYIGNGVDYRPEPTAEAIGRVFESRGEVIVISVFASESEFQKEMIPKAFDFFPEKRDHIRFRGDGILPDPEIVEWIVQSYRNGAIRSDSAVQSPSPAAL